MRRMFLMSSALLATLALAGLAHSDDDLTVLHPGPNDIPAGRVLSTYLLEQAKTHFDARRAAIARLTTPALIDAYRSQLRSRFVASFGALPEERTPLNPRVVGRKARNAYSVERVIYESRPGFHVTANFYIPDGTGPFPGVLVPCGHSDNGKAAETYQRIAILLARNGMAALCYDPIGQGERLQLLDASGKAAIKGSTTEHTMIGAGALLVGRTAAGYRLWDGLRSLDYLASRPEVDPGRLGCTGNSGGGTMTAYLMAFDDRIQAAAPSCYITSLERLFTTIGPQDAEQNLYGQVASGIEHADFITLRSPRPTLLSVGTKDFFDIDGSWTTFREVKEIYGTLGYGERIDLFESNEPHGFTRPRRVSCMRFLRRWLLDRNDAPTEPDFPIAPDRELQCTETGQVLSSLKGRSAFQLTAERAEELDRARAARAGHREPGELQALVKKTLDLPGSQSILVENHRSIERPGYRIDLWTLATEPGAVVIERLFRPENAADGKPMVVYLGADRALAAPGGEIEKRVLAGEIVAMIEPRGTGETTPSGKTSRKGPFGPDESEAFLSFHLARPLLAQRAYDVIQAFRAMQKPDDPEARGFHLVGVGAMAPVALHVAAIDSRVKELTLVRPLISWSALARTPVHRDQLANVLYGVLASYDLPEVAASLAPRPLTLRGVVDPAGKAADPTEVAQVYAACLAAYKTAGAAEHLRITNEP